jgi:hypothetical protein
VAAVPALIAHGGLAGALVEAAVVLAVVAVFVAVWVRERRIRRDEDREQPESDRLE